MSESPINYPPLFLRRGEDRRLRAGHLWVFSNEVDIKRSPLDGFSAGDPVLIVDAGGHAVGTGYVNPGSLICARLLDRGGHPLDRSLLVHRLNVALALRQRIHTEPYYRLLFGESDGVPGLTVDRFDDVLVAQATTAGIDDQHRIAGAESIERRALDVDLVAEYPQMAGAKAAVLAAAQEQGRIVAR